MRAAPLGLLFPEIQATVAAAAEQSLVTHLDPRCAAGAVAIAVAARRAATEGPLDRSAFLGAVADQARTQEESVASAIAGLETWRHLPPEEAARWLHAEGLDPAYTGEWQGMSAAVTPSGLRRRHAFLRRPDDDWGGVWPAIGVGGDTGNDAGEGRR